MSKFTLEDPRETANWLVGKIIGVIDLLARCCCRALVVALVAATTR